MKRRYFKRLCNRAVSLAVAFSMTASLCLVASVMPTAGAEEAGEAETFGEPHVHTFACYEHFELDCKEGHPEDGHRERCYTYSGELVCGMEEGQLHDHDMSGCEAVARVLVCKEDADGDILGDGTDLIAGEEEEETEEEPDKEERGPAGEGGSGGGSGSGNGSGGSNESNESVSAPEKPEGNGIGSGETKAEDGSVPGESEDSGSQEGGTGSEGDGGNVSAGGNEGAGGSGGNGGSSDIEGEENEGSIGAGGNESQGGADAGNGQEEDGAGSGGSGEDGSTGSDGSEGNGSTGAGGDEDGGSGSTEGNGAEAGAGSSGTEENGTGGETASEGNDSKSDGDANEDQAVGENYALFTAGRLMQGHVSMRRIDAGSWFLVNHTAPDLAAVGDAEEAEDAAAEKPDGDWETEEPESAPEEEEEDHISGEDGRRESEPDSRESAGEDLTVSPDVDHVEDKETEEAVPAEGTAAGTGNSEEASAGLDETESDPGEEEEIREIPAGEETVAGGIASASNADGAIDEEGHIHSEECYVTIYRCRGMMLMAVREGNVRNQEELEKAVAEGKEIVIANSFPVNSTIVLQSGKPVVMDLNGYTLQFEGPADAAMFSVPGGAALTVKDSESSWKKVQPVRKGAVDKPGQTVYDEVTKELTYYVTECEVNLDGRSTTNTVWEYAVDLDSSGVGTLDGRGIGAVVSVTGGKLNIKNGRIRNKKEFDIDGRNGITMDSGEIIMEGGYIVDCGAGNEDGGAIKATGGNINISGGVIANNKGKSGGAIWIKNSGSTLAISNSVIAYNESIMNGGAIYNTNATINIEGMTAIVGNRAGNDGGGVLSYGSTSQVKFTGGHIAGNSAVGLGGGFYFESSGTDNLIGNIPPVSSDKDDNQNEANVIIANNSAEKNGGGIYTTKSIIKINSNKAKTVILGNTAKQQGGGIYSDGQKMITIGGKSIIAANTANDTTADSNSTYPAPSHTASFTIGTDCYVEGMWNTSLNGAVASVADLRNAINGASSNPLDTTVIPLGGNLTMEGEQTLGVDKGKNIVLDLRGYKIEGNPADGGSIFSVTGKDSSLTIRDSEAGEDPAPQRVGASAGIPENAGRVGTYENGLLTYYVAESDSTGIHTAEQTWEYRLDPGARTGNKKPGVIQASGADSVISAWDNARIVIEGGMITNPGGRHGISVEKNSALMMKGGYIVGSGSESGTGSGKADGGGIIAKGSRLQMTGGVIAGNKASGDGGGIKVEDFREEVTANGKRAVTVTKSNLQITGGIIAANTAQDRGGGLGIDGGSAQIGGDTVIAGNLAHGQTPREGSEEGEEDVEDGDKWKNAVNFHGGGGIFFNGDKEIGETLKIQDDCYITNNYADKANIHTGTGGTGGGGIFARGLLQMSGGNVTGNRAKAAGGGVYLHSYYGKAATADQFPTRVGQYTMTGGTIAGNYAETEEGGGLHVDGKEGSIKGSGIYITNNKTGTIENWGGGGIFVMSSAGLNIRNVLITENTAEGFGGGVAGCNHGTNRVFAIQGGAIFNNTAFGGGGKLEGYQSQALPKKDHRNHADRIDARTPVIEGEKKTEFIAYSYDGGKKSYQDFYCSNISQVYDRMLGGGSANWSGSYSNSSKTEEHLPEASPLRIEADSYASASNMIGLNANPASGAVTAAKNTAGVFITGNRSAAHGGGVMSNGTFEIGSNPGGEGGLTIRKEVQLADGTKISDNNEKFTFKVSWKDENGREDNSGRVYIGLLDPAVSDQKQEIEIRCGDTVELYNGQSLKIAGLPIGEYEVREISGDAYVRLPHNGLANGPLWQHFASEAIFRNIPKGKLTIKKAIYEGGSPIPAGDPRESDEFRFTVKFTDKQGNMLLGEYPDAYPYTKNEEEYTMPSEGGKIYPTVSNGGEFTLKHNESITIHDLPAGAYYEVAEKKAEGYLSVPVKKGIVENSGTASYLEIHNESGRDPENPEDPTPNHPGGGGGGGGGGGSDPKDPTPPPTETSPETPSEEAAEPEPPAYPEELPDPNDPESPERITILENGVPRTYLKMWDPEKEEFMYIPEDEIPLAFMLPPTGDRSRRIIWAMVCGLSLSGMAALSWGRRRKKH